MGTICTRNVASQVALPPAVPPPTHSHTTSTAHPKPTGPLPPLPPTTAPPPTPTLQESKPDALPPANSSDFDIAQPPLPSTSTSTSTSSSSASFPALPSTPPAPSLLLLSQPPSEILSVSSQYDFTYSSSSLLGKSSIKSKSTLESQSESGPQRAWWTSGRLGEEPFLHLSFPKVVFGRGLRLKWNGKVRDEWVRAGYGVVSIRRIRGKNIQSGEIVVLWERSEGGEGGGGMIQTEEELEEEGESEGEKCCFVPFCLVSDVMLREVWVEWEPTREGKQYATAEVVLLVGKEIEKTRPAPRPRVEFPYRCSVVASALSLSTAAEVTSEKPSTTQGSSGARSRGYGDFVRSGGVMPESQPEIEPEALESLAVEYRSLVESLTESPKKRERKNKKKEREKENRYDRPFVSRLFRDCLPSVDAETEGEVGVETEKPEEENEIVVEEEGEVEVGFGADSSRTGTVSATATALGSPSDLLSFGSEEKPELESESGLAEKQQPQQLSAKPLSPSTQMQQANVVNCTVSDADQDSMIDDLMKDQDKRIFGSELVPSSSQTLPDDPEALPEEDSRLFAVMLKKITGEYGLHPPDVYASQSLHQNIIYSRGVPVPIYRSLNWLGEFGDEYLPHTSYDDRGPYMEHAISSLANWVLCFRKLLTINPHWISHETDMPDPRTDERVTRLLKILDGGVDIAKTKGRFLRGQGDGDALSGGLHRFVTEFWIPKLRKMDVGEIVCLHGGWCANPGHAVFYTIQRLGPDNYSFIISNSGGGLGYHASSEKDFPVSKAAVDGRIDDIPKKRMHRGVTWMLMFLIGSYATDAHSSLSLYEVVIPLLLPPGLSLRSAFSRSFHKPDVAAKMMIPQQSGTCYYKSTTFGTRYLMRLIGIPDRHVHTIRFAIMRQFMSFALEDVRIQPTLTPSELRLIRIGMEQVVVLGKVQMSRDRVDMKQLKEIQDQFESLEEVMSRKPLLELQVPRKLPRELPLGRAFPNEEGKTVIRFPCSPFRHFDLLDGQEMNERVRRPHDCEETRLSGYLSLVEAAEFGIEKYEDLLRVFNQGTAISDAAMEIRDSSRFYHVIGLCEKIFLELVPLPKMFTPKKCFFATLSFTRAQQIELLKAIESLTLRYRAASESVPVSQSMLSTKLLSLAVSFVLIDALVRLSPSDQKSVVADALSEYYTCDGTIGDGVSFSTFCRNLDVSEGSHSGVLRSLNEYFHFQRMKLRKPILEIPRDHWVLFMGTELRLVKRILEQHGITELVAEKDHHTKEMESHDVQILARYFFSSGSYDLCRVAPEIPIWRDARFSLAFAYRDTPDRDEVWNGETFDWTRGKWFFYKGDIKDLNSPHTVKVHMSWGTFRKYRGLSAAPVLQNLAAPSNFILEKLGRTITESDVLYNRKLPSFGEALTQEDAEKLFSFLVVPYLRVPLTLDFFTSADRASLLLNKQIQVFLWHVLFRPGRWISSFNFNHEAYSDIPCKMPLGTPQGLLQNELVLSPSVVLDPLLNILRFAFRKLSTETYKQVIAETILFVIRVASAVDGFVCSILMSGEAGDLETRLRSSQRELRKLLVEDGQPIIVDWIDTSKDVFLKSKLYFHIALIYRHFDVFDSESAMWLLTSLFYVNLWYGFSGNILDTSPVPLVRPVEAPSSPDVVPDEAQGTSSGSGAKEQFLDEIGFFRIMYGVVPSISSHFQSKGIAYASAVLSAVLTRLNVNCEEVIQFRPLGDSNESFISVSGDLVVHLPQFKCFFRDQIIRPIGDSIMRNFDYQCCFGKKPRHASVLEETEELSRLVVMGTPVRHELVYWKKPKLNQFNLRAETVVEEEFEGESSQFTLLDECVGSYVRTDGAVDSKVTATLSQDGVWKTTEHWYFHLKDSPVDSHLDVVGPEQHAEKGWKLRVFRDSDGIVESIQFFNHVYTLTESNSRVPSKNYHRWYSSRSLYDREYDPESLPENQKWIALTLEPVLADVFDAKKESMKSSNFSLYMPSDRIDDTDEFVTLLARHLPTSEGGGVVPKDAEEALYGGPTWKEVIVHRRPVRRVEVYNLVEFGRKVYRELVYTSDSRLSFADSSVSTSTRNACWFEGFQFASGDLMRKCERRDTLEIVRDFVPTATSPESLSGTKEKYIPSDFLVGSIPQFLAVNFVFWLRENQTIIGEPRRHIRTENVFDYSLRIDLLPDGRGHVKKITSSGEELDLINLCRSNPLVDVFTRIENLSHVLCWGRVVSESAEALCEIFEIDLPRLKLGFVPGRSSNGELRLYNVNNAGLFITNRRDKNLAKLVKGIPHSLVLEDSAKSLYVLVPSYPVRVPGIQWQPLHDNLVQLRNDEEWLSQPLRTFVYPLHSSGSFLTLSNLSSHLYLILLRLWGRQYNEACELLKSISIDSVASASELFFLSLFEAMNEFDYYPDSFAAKLRLVLGVKNLEDFELPFSSATLGSYLQRSAHVRDGCKITLDEIALLSENTFFQKMKRQLQDGESGLTHEIKEYSPSRLTTTRWEKIEAEALDYLRSREARQWEADFCYVRPPTKRLVGENCVKFVRQCWDDQPSGCVNKLGFLFIFEILTGKIRLSLDGKSDDSFILGRALAAAMYFQTTQQLTDVFAKDSLKADRCFTPFAVLASLTRNLSKIYQPIRNPGFSPVKLEKTIGMYVHPDGKTLCLFRDGRAQYQDMKDLSVNLSGDGQSFRLPPANWYAELEFRDPENVVGVKMWGASWRKTPLYRMTRFVFPEVPNDDGDAELQPLWPERGSDGVSCSSTVETVARKAEFFVNHLCDVAEDVLGSTPDAGAVVDHLIDDVGSMSVPEVRPSYLEIPVGGDHSCSSLSFPRTDSLGSLAEVLLEDVLDLSEMLDDFAQASGVQDGLGFDVGFHEHSKSYSGQKLLSRLEKDKKAFVSDISSAVDRFFKHTFDGDRVNCFRLLVSLEKVLQDRFDSELVQFRENAECISKRSNRVSVTGKESQFFLVEKIAREGYISFPRLCSFVTSRDFLRDLRVLNPHLEETNVVDLHVETSIEMMRVLRLRVIGRALASMQKMKSMLVKKKIGKSFQNESKNLAQILSTKRWFVSDAGDSGLVMDPRYLYFEFANSIVMRKMQIDILRSFLASNSDSMVRQLIMGAGKTTVIGPLLTLILATSDELVVHVVPSPLVHFTQSVLRTKFSRLISKKVMTLAFDRSPSWTPEKIKDLHDSLLLCRRSKDVVVASPEAVKSLFLKFVELLNKNRSDERIPHLRAILRLWKSSCTLIADEVDMLLHPLKSELNFPVGKKLKLDCSPERWEIPIHLYDALSFWKTKEISVSLFANSTDAKHEIAALEEVIRLGIAQHAFQKNPHLVLLDKAFYFSKVKPRLIQLLLIWLQHKHVFHNIDQSLVVRYLARVPGQEIDYESQILMLPPLHRQYLNLIHDHINVFVPHALSKIDRVSFGLLTQKEITEMPAKMPVSRALLAIPFVGKDVPSASSEFAHPDILISLSILGYLYEGLRAPDIRNVIVLLKRSLLREVGPRSQRPSALLFQKWIEYAKLRAKGELTDVKINPLTLLQLSDEDQMKNVHALLRDHPGVIYYYLNTRIFPEQMHHHCQKLSASGQELGGDILFRRRLGFSGTPNNLIPLSLGECQYQIGADGKIISTLCDPKVVSAEPKESSWTVKSLLMDIARSTNYHCLIDTGAIITGMRNEEVARFLLMNGLQHLKGVVFLNEDDKQMIILRGEDNPLPLNECGIGWHERFTFYDQVHTTGIDIKQCLNAVAVQTVGKDSVLRDVAQGAWRMRGIGDGQTIRYFVVPEILNLIRKELGSHFDPSPDRMINNICAWLVINGMLLENLQFAQLQQQNLGTVWRRIAYEELLQSESFASDWIGRCFSTFREDVDFSVVEEIPTSLKFSDLVDRLVEEHQEFLSRDPVHANADLALIREMSANTSRTTNVFDSEQEREAEVEVEQERESEQEQQQKVSATRDEEEEVPWKVNQLRRAGGKGHPFYRLSNLEVFGDKLSFPKDLLVSNNFYREHYDVEGFRRLKNVYLILHWIPSTKKLRRTPHPHREMTPERTSLSQKIFAMFDCDQSGTMDSEELESLLREVGLQSRTAEILSSADADSSNEIDAEEFLHLVEVGFSPTSHLHAGRYYVLLSLSEFESLRFLLHAGHTAFASNTSLCLGIQLLNGPFLGATPNFRQVVGRLENEPTVLATQCYKFLNSDFHFSNFELNLLMCALEDDPAQKRQSLFDNILRCRRREKNKYTVAPISRLFRLSDGLSWMLTRAIRFRLLWEVDRRGLKLADCFKQYDLDSDGFLSLSEMTQSLSHLHLSETDIRSFVDGMDANRDSLVDLAEFWTYLSGEDETEEEGEGQLSTSICQMGTRRFRDSSVLSVRLGLVDRQEEDGSDPEIEEMFRCMFRGIEPSEGYAFSGSLSRSLYHVSVEMRSMSNQKKLKELMLLAREGLVQDAIQDPNYWNISHFLLGAMREKDFHHDKGRRILFMIASDVIPEPVRESALGSAWLFNWAFKDWGVDHEKFKELYEAKPKSQSIEDAVYEFKIANMSTRIEKFS